GSTFALSPARWVSARSPARATLTFRSVSSCRSVSRATWTSRTSALPYRLAPRTIATGSTPSVGRVAERAEHQRYMQVPARVGDGEDHDHLGEEGVPADVGSGVEDQAVRTRPPLFVRYPVAQPPVVVGTPVGDLCP